MEYTSVPPEMLPSDVLQGLMEAFINREGTDYGEVSLSLDQKRDRLERELRNGRAVIVYQAESDSWNILPARDLARLEQQKSESP